MLKIDMAIPSDASIVETLLAFELDHEALAQITLSHLHHLAIRILQQTNNSIDLRKRKEKRAI